MSGEYDVVVVGGGLAGLSAALTSGRLGRRTALLTGDVLGGQLVSINRIEGVPGFPETIAGYDLCPMTQEQADAVGVAFVMAAADAITAEDGVWRIASAEGELTARGVILATGTALAKLDIPGEERLFGKGVSHCASCDAPLLRNKTAVVVGGGDSAMQEALELAEHAGRVIMLVQAEALAGQAAYRDQVYGNGKIEVRTGVSVSEILGEDGVRAVRLGDGSELATDAVFAFIGLVPNSALVDGIAALDASFRVVVDAALRSTAIGIAAAGNVRAAAAHRAAGAMGDGATAALAIDAWLTSGAWRD